MAQELEHIGTVVASEEGYSTVRFARSSACKTCGACLVAGDNEMEVKAIDELGAKEGDKVKVSLKASSMLMASALCYAVPLGLLLVGTFVGSLFGDVYAIVLGLGLCTISFLILRLLEKRFKRSQRFVPRIIEIEEENENG